MAKKKQTKESLELLVVSIGLGLLFLYSVATTLVIVRYINSTNNSHYNLQTRINRLEERIEALEQK